MNDFNEPIKPKKSSSMIIYPVILIIVASVYLWINFDINKVIRMPSMETVGYIITPAGDLAPTKTMYTWKGNKKDGFKGLALFMVDNKETAVQPERSD